MSRDLLVMCARNLLLASTSFAQAENGDETTVGLACMGCFPIQQNLKSDFVSKEAATHVHGMVDHSVYHDIIQISVSVVFGHAIMSQDGHQSFRPYD